MYIFTLKNIFYVYFFFFFQAEDGIRDLYVTGVQTCALPICNPGGGLGGNTQVSSKLVNLLKQDAGRYRWAAATVGTQSAAPLQLATRQPMLAIGGFNGSDPAPTLAQFKRLVSAGQIHYFVGANASSFGGGTGSAAQITSWVAAHFTSQTVGGVAVYDLAR